MSDNQNFGFGKFVPGFDFLQNLTKGASQALPQMPNLSSWVAPTLNVEELDKRIGELKAVHFWLDQNSKALGATIQALEVQKMTLATLKGMNFNMGEIANALTLKATDTMFAGGKKSKEKAADDEADADSDSDTDSAPAEESETPEETGKATGRSSGVIDPLQWWGALTQQFQQIATSAMKDAVTQTAEITAKRAKGPSGAAKAATGAAAGKKTKAAAKRTGRKKAS